MIVNVASGKDKIYAFVKNSNAIKTCYAEAPAESDESSGTARYRESYRLRRRRKRAP